MYYASSNVKNHSPSITGSDHGQIGSLNELEIVIITLKGKKNDIRLSILAGVNKYEIKTHYLMELVSGRVFRMTFKVILTPLAHDQHLETLILPHLSHDIHRQGETLHHPLGHLP